MKSYTNIIPLNPTLASYFINPTISNDNVTGACNCEAGKTVARFISVSEAKLTRSIAKYSSKNVVNIILLCNVK